MRRASGFVFVWLFLVVAGLVHAAAAPLLIRVERKQDGDLKTLLEAGLPVVLETKPCLFVRGRAADVAALAAKGYQARVIDESAATSDYVMVGMRPDTDSARVVAAGKILLAEENWMLLRVPAGSHPAGLEEAQVWHSTMPTDPVAIPKPPPAIAATPLLAPNPIVQKIVSTVADASIQNTWTSIVNNPPNGTRFSTTQGCRDASAYCLNQFAAYKVPAAYQTWSGTNAPNVVGTHAGATRPQDVYIIVAHLDDLPSTGIAPGANDNGSGSAAVLESAKALSCWGVRNTVKFLNVTGEEQGLFGSDAYAADALTRGENILGVINYDMIGWAGDGLPAVENLDLDYNAPSQWLAQKMVDAAANYATGLVINPILCPSLTVSDHYPFWQRGWAAICGITDNEGYCGAAGNYPPYHTSGDTIAANGNLAFYYKVVKTTVATLAELGDPFKVTFSGATYGCGSPVQVILADRDLNTSPVAAQTVGVHIWSTTEPAGETLTLTERTVDNLLFDGTMATTANPAVTGDGFLSVAAGDVIHVDYVDALDCDGASNVAYAATAAVDCAPPVISGVAATNVTGNSAIINWTTDEPSTSVVHYGTTPPGASTASSAGLVTGHALPLTGLAECTPYSYWVASADAVGNTASDDAAGAYYGFTTLKNTTPDYVNTTPVAIPDNNATGATSTINVPDDKIVQDVNVKVNITHTYDADITLYLITPTNVQITLSALHGGSGDNYTDTVFDDEAATPIASGTAPFTGSFRPDQPLTAADGLSAAGAWRLKVVDSAGQDVGTINNWTLSLMFPALSCGPHATYASNGEVADTCSVGGAGNANGTWDPGEQVQLKVGISNDGTMPLTGITATLSSTTPGVVMIDPTASYPDLATGATADSAAPHFTVKLPAGLACGSTVAFNVTIQSAQGSWAGSFTHAVGAVASGNGTALNETFAGGIPATWSVVDGGTGTGAAATWTTANPGARTFAAPLVAPVAMVDSDNAGSSATQDEQLITPVMNLATATGVTLEFDQYYRNFTGGLAENADVDVRSTATGGVWTTVLHQTTVSSTNPDHKTINITAQAAGAANVQVRFHYWNAQFEWWWEVDNVKVTYTAPSGCQSNVCNVPNPPPPPVPDGTTGTPMRADRTAPDGSSIGLTWDVSSCGGAGYKAVYGSFANLATYTVDGAACGLGTSGSASWSGVPAGDLWYFVVAVDGAGTEGSWGPGNGGPAGGTTPSASCGDAVRNNAGTCP